MRKWPDDFINKIICDDCLEVMKEMPDGCIDMCLTSPPYWGLRDYGIEQIFGGNKDCKHEWIDKTIIRRTPGDKPGKSSLVAKNRPNDIVNRPNIKQNVCQKCGAWKGQLGLEPTPEMYIEHLTKIFNEVKRVLRKRGTLWLNIGDSYYGGGHGGWVKFDDGRIPYKDPKFGKGRNYCPAKNWDYSKYQPKCLCMIPERFAWSLIQDGWILRNKIIWYKPNAMPSSVKDRFNNTWEYVYMFSKNRKYYFDLDAVRESHKPQSIKRASYGFYDTKKHQQLRETNMASHKLLSIHNVGKNPGDMWAINTQPFPEAHFAVFPEKLCVKPIKAGCPESGITLDPFCGSGTVLFVAQHLRCRYIGIEMNPEYRKMAEERLAQGVL